MVAIMVIAVVVIMVIAMVVIMVIAVVVVVVTVVMVVVVCTAHCCNSNGECFHIICFEFEHVFACFEFVN